MSDEARRRWERVAAIVGEAGELAGPAREAYLARALADEEPALAEEVRELLGQSERADAWLAEMAERVAGVADDALEEPSLAGKRVGPYRLVRLLGRGGMGVVWLAERDDGQYEREVALKLLPIGFDEEASRRFLAERFKTSVLADYRCLRRSKPLHA